MQNPARTQPKEAAISIGLMEDSSSERVGRHASGSAISRFGPIVGINNRPLDKNRLAVREDGIEGELFSGTGCSVLVNEP
jgi:hypothetical protein